MRMRSNIGKFAVVALLGASLLGGCRFKGVESFVSATTPNAPGPGQWKGDRYTGAGYAEASGGINAQTRYGTGARANTNAPIDPTFDQAAKGTGSQPGEYPVSAAPGFGHSNGPGMQPAPSEASSLSVRTGQ